ncbi:MULTISPECIES: hypothetical protein [unclassified Oscillibacter]|uniref:hypothetical protein n=1 Tax=unclassified Oscillibacter TaxID=2629304 RepID=UPI0003ADB139|nr:MULTISPECIES: hypothetical protein [unclassified Oscillibacter]ERK62981.1 hypothetical protein HMPREF1546_02327 [Oscillibacter sp. KLE 1745]ERK65051.1 hypothetical protein HMPREF1545_00023 [Oscillibacter sp. KLE 1728]
MKLEEAIVYFESLLKRFEEMRETETSYWGKVHTETTIEAIRTALAALRPVSRERVEKVFPGCPYCKPDSEGYVQKFGAYSILNGELKTGHCKPQKIGFCPHCSRPLTDEAVEMVMKRMEVLNDAD